MTALHFTIRGLQGERTLTIDSGAGPVWLGRDANCEIPLVAECVSRRHTAVELTAAGLQVSDSSRNGTRVNGVLLRKAARVFPGGCATLQIGLFRVRVATDEGARRSADQHSGATESLADDTPRAARPSQGRKESRKKGSVAGAVALTRRQIHRQLLENLDLASLDRAAMDLSVMRPKVIAALRRILDGSECGTTEYHETLVQELADEVLGLGPLEQLLSDSDVSEIMVVDPQTIFVERRGRMELTDLRFTDDDSVRAVIERIVTPLGRRIDESSPLVDARLKDGSRVNAVIPPLALRGPCITIRKFTKEPLGMPDLVGFGSLSREMARFLTRSVKARKNIVISGGTGSGKTTLLNVLSGAIPSGERVVTVEDAAELQLVQPHVVSLESRPPNLEGKGEYSIRDLVRNALRMRPDRIVVGECRGGEALDMLQAMNTGHEGSLTTTHANSPKEAIARIETLCLMAGLDLPVRAIRQQIASSIHLIVQQARYSDGARRVSSIAEVVGIDDDGEVSLREIFRYKVTNTRSDGNVEGRFLASGYLPSFLDEFVAHGLMDDGVAL